MPNEQEEVRRVREDLILERWLDAPTNPWSIKMRVLDRDGVEPIFELIDEGGLVS